MQGRPSLGSVLDSGVVDRGDVDVTQQTSERQSVRASERQSTEPICCNSFEEVHTLFFLPITNDAKRKISILQRSAVNRELTIQLETSETAQRRSIEFSQRRKHARVGYVNTVNREVKQTRALVCRSEQCIAPDVHVFYLEDAKTHGTNVQSCLLFVLTGFLLGKISHVSRGNTSNQSCQHKTRVGVLAALSVITTSAT